MVYVGSWFDNHQQDTHLLDLVDVSGHRGQGGEVLARVLHGGHAVALTHQLQELLLVQLQQQETHTAGHEAERSSTA